MRNKFADSNTDMVTSANLEAIPNLRPTTDTPLATAAEKQLSPEEVKNGLSEGEWQLRQQLFKDIRDHLWGVRQTSFDHINNIIIGLSSGLFGLSVSFVKDIVPLARAIYLPALWGSWICFVASILVILVSHWASSHASDLQITYAEKYYLECDKDYLNKKNIWTTRTEWCNIISAICFVLGVALTGLFSSINIVEESRYQQKLVAQ